MRMWSEALCGRHSRHSAHVIVGPPYSFLIVDKPDAANAFSYGFGPDGACGVVVYSGFLDNILSKAPSSTISSDYTLHQTLPEETSWWTPFWFALHFTTSPITTPSGTYRTANSRARYSPRPRSCASRSITSSRDALIRNQRQIMGTSHPVNEVRVEQLKSELVRWELEKRVAEKKRVVGEPEQRSMLGLI
jgi:hypothetical protein